ncbi:hypothetical protein J4424_06020 [Candidatus Woesearchaeota archaeon]|nr:hypothetical protein [Candidatus Woesearchaeota archaeon]
MALTKKQKEMFLTMKKATKVILLEDCSTTWLRNLSCIDRYLSIDLDRAKIKRSFFSFFPFIIHSLLNF